MYVGSYKPSSSQHVAHKTILGSSVLESHVLYDLEQNLVDVKDYEIQDLITMINDRCGVVKSHIAMLGIGCAQCEEKFCS